jgi:hypothetical protein
MRAALGLALAMMLGCGHDARCTHLIFVGPHDVHDRDPLVRILAANLLPAQLFRQLGRW